MQGLYPLKFKPIILDKIWGGSRLINILGKNSHSLSRCGESWELSAVEGMVSVVSNGFLSGNNLTELAEIYMGDLVGEKIYDTFGAEFPLLFKFIDANEDLSIQVHPDDVLAKKRHFAYGKTEMWYVIHAEPGALINAGFSTPVTSQEYQHCLQSGKITEILRFEEVKAGDVFFIPAGRVHAIGKGVLLAEIQQTSDVTYRIYDYGRIDDGGKPRELHTELALGAIHFDYAPDYKTPYTAQMNQSTEIVSCPYFTTNLLRFSEPIEKDYHRLDSFIVYMCLDGAFQIEYEQGIEPVHKGETILIPAALETFTLIPTTDSAEVLEVYIK